MRMKLFVVLIIAAGVVGATEPVTFRADARVEVDAAGRPTKIEASRDLPEPIRTFIERTVATWHFTPPSRDGIVSAGVTYLSLGACAMPEGNGYRMAVDFKGNGPGLTGYRESFVPRYPFEAIRAGRETSVVAKWIVETNGLASLERVEKKGGMALRKNDPFYVSIKEWLAQLRYKPEELAGQPIRTRISMPMDFSFLSGRSTPEADKQEKMDKLMQSSECQIVASKMEEKMRAVAVDSPVAVEVP